MSDTQDERARDLVRRGELRTRSRLGERLLSRVGSRGWGRPNVAVSARLYKRYGLADPWDPSSKGRDRDPVQLGPVSLRLGEKRREPAPHLRPKRPKAEKEVDPVAKYRRPQPKPVAEAKPPPPPPPKKPAPALPTQSVDGESPPSMFGKRDEKQPLRAPLPVRPDIGQPGAGKAGPRPPRRSTQSVNQGGRMAPPGPSRPAKPALAPLPKRPDAPKRASGAGGAGPQASLPRPALPARNTKRKRAGRFSMRPTEVRSPVVVQEPEVVILDAVVEDTPPPKPPPKAVNRSIPTGPMGLDDLFGAATEGGRVSMRRMRPKKPPPEDDNPKED